MTRRRRWRGIPIDPMYDTRDKQSLFVHFAPIVDAISRAGTARGHVPNAKLVQHLAEEANEPSDVMLPDGCIVPVGSDGENWEDITALGWYNKFGDCRDYFEVSLHMLYSAHANPARRLSTRCTVA